MSIHRSHRHRDKLEHMTSPTASPTTTRRRRSSTGRDSEAGSEDISTESLSRSSQHDAHELHKQEVDSKRSGSISGASSVRSSLSGNTSISAHFMAPTNLQNSDATRGSIPVVAAFTSIHDWLETILHGTFFYIVYNIVCLICLYFLSRQSFRCS